MEKKPNYYVVIEQQYFGIISVLLYSFIDDN